MHMSAYLCSEYLCDGPREIINRDGFWGGLKCFGAGGGGRGQEVKD